MNVEKMRAVLVSMYELELSKNGINNHEVEDKQIDLFLNEVMQNTDKNLERFVKVNLVQRKKVLAKIASYM
jgi:DNA-binding phage protein